MGKREAKVADQKKRQNEADKEELGQCYRATKFILGLLLAVASSGPLLCVMTQQVCVTKCLMLRRLPTLNADLDNVLLVIVYVFYVLLNYLMLCIVWSLFRKALRFVYLRYGYKGVSVPLCVEDWILMDPKITRSGKVYGYRKAKYVNCKLSGGRNGGGLMERK